MLQPSDEHSSSVGLARAVSHFRHPAATIPAAFGVQTLTLPENRVNWLEMGLAPPPGVFLRKDVILRWLQTRVS